METRKETVTVAFLGDICLARPSPTVEPDILGMLLGCDLVVANLEGAILDENYDTQANPGVYNTPETLSFLRDLHVTAVNLCNNHIMDYPEGLVNTCRILDTEAMPYFGAGSNLQEAAKPLPATTRGGDVAVFSFGWNVIGCVPARTRREGVNPLRRVHALRTVRDFRSSHPDKPLVVLMHWDFELEYWPQPADRELARELIDEGADAVVGMHSHVPQGVEWFAGKPIVYGLGNFWFPPRHIGGFELQFPEKSNRELVPRIRFAGREVESLRLHWLRADTEANTLVVETVEDAAGPVALELTPFSGMPQREYEKWFAVHRVKRRWLPIYRDHRHVVRNLLRGAFVALRQKGIDMLKRSGLKRGLSHSRSEGK